MRYKAELEAIDPSVEYLMTLYLSPELTPEEIRKAAQAGIVGAPHLPRAFPFDLSVHQNPFMCGGSARCALCSPGHQRD